MRHSVKLQRAAFTLRVRCTKLRKLRACFCAWVHPTCGSWLTPSFAMYCLWMSLWQACGRQRDSLFKNMPQIYMQLPLLHHCIVQVTSSPCKLFTAAIV